MPPGLTRLVLIRHAETAWNVGNVFRGRLDVPLNEAGRDQAQRLGEALRGVPLAAVWSGPLGRAMETARAVAAPHGLTVTGQPAFDNIDLGHWQGRPKADVQQTEPLRWRKWVECPERLRIPGGESIPQLRRRVAAGLVTLRAGYPDQTVAVVTHRSVLKVALAEIFGLRGPCFWKFSFANASHSSVEWRPDMGWTVVSLNCTCHLETVTEEQF